MSEPSVAPQDTAARLAEIKKRSDEVTIPWPAKPVSLLLPCGVTVTGPSSGSIFRFTGVSGCRLLGSSIVWQNRRELAMIAGSATERKGEP